MKKNVASLEKIVQELLGFMDVAAKVSASYDKKGDVYTVDLDAGEATGLLIGKKGETLTSMQTVLSVLLKQKTGEWLRVVLNVGDYREKEEDYLKNLAQSAADRAKETGEPQNLYNLKPWQRRIIHLYLSEEKSVETESVGEGEERYLIVRSKSA